MPAGIRRLSKPLGLAASTLMVGFLGLTDYLTGRELSFSIFYLVPISVAALACGLPWTVLVSLASAGTWMWADLAAGSVYSSPLIPFWNAVVRLGYFILHSLLLTMLVRQSRRLRSMALHDPLTGAINSRHFEVLVRRELERARRSKSPITIAYADLDNFKGINDSLGHGAGDEVLRTVVSSIGGSIRPGDILARMGGDEFALVLPDTDREGATLVLDRLRATLRNEFRDNRWAVSLSVGAVTFRSAPASFDALVQRADELMYRVKESGKDDLRLETWPPDVDGAAAAHP